LPEVGDPKRCYRLASRFNDGGVRPTASRVADRLRRAMLFEEASGDSAAAEALFGSSDAEATAAASAIARRVCPAATGTHAASRAGPLSRAFLRQRGALRKAADAASQKAGDPAALKRLVDEWTAHGFSGDDLVCARAAALAKRALTTVAVAAAAESFVQPPPPLKRPGVVFLS